MNDFIGFAGVLALVLATGGFLLLMFDVITGFFKKRGKSKKLDTRDKVIIVLFAIIVAFNIVF